MKLTFTWVCTLLVFFCAAQDPASKTEKPRQPLVVIDGIKHLRSDSASVLQKLDPAKVKQIVVLKDREAMDLYGEDGRFGVVVVTTESAVSRQPLFLLDGKRVADLAGIDPQDIASVEVIKDSVQLQPYGPDGKWGVVKITSKAAKLR